MADTAAEGKPGRHLQLVGKLQDQAAEVRRLCSELSEEELARRTVAEKWSVKELLCHVLRVQRMFAGRLDAMLTQEDPAIVSYEPEGDPEFERLAARPGSETLAAFEKERVAIAALLAALSPMEWHRPGRHPEYPDIYDVHFAMEYMAHHEAHHIYQMYLRRAPLGKKLPH